jgi:hypothetical protein
LPPPLESLARRKSTFLGSPGDEAFQGVPDLNPVLAGTPWLFWELFSGLDDEVFLHIAEAGALYVLASIVLDHIIDGQAEPAHAMALFHQALYENGVARFRAALPSTSGFWGQFDRLAADHLRGLAAELDAQSNPHRLTLETFLAMAHGKVGPIVTTVAALAEASRRPGVLGPIEASLKHIAVASQLLDDVGDWEHDAHVGHLTYYMAHVLPPDAWQSESRPSADELQGRIDAEWADVDHLRMVIEWLDRAVDAVGSLECPRWVKYVDGYRTLADQHLTTAMARHFVRVLKPLVFPPEG